MDVRDGERVSHRDAEGFAVERIAAARREDDGDISAGEGGGGTEDRSEVVVVCEVLEDDEGASGLEQVVELGLLDSESGGEESSVDGVSGDLVEYWARRGVDRDFVGDLAQELSVGFDLGFVDENGVEWVSGSDVMLEDEGAFGDEEWVFGRLVFI